MTEKNPYLDLDEKGVKEQIALFKEALEGKEDIDLYTEFALEKPKEITEDEKAELAVLQENTDKLSEINKLLGVSKSATPSVEKKEPTAVEKELLDRQEKLEQSAFTNVISEVKSINSEFDSEKIEGLDISTSDKVVLMGTVKEIVTKYQTGYDKLKTELDTKNSAVKDTKLSASKNDATQTNTDTSKLGASKDIVAKFADKYQFKRPETKTEIKPETKTE